MCCKKRFNAALSARWQLRCDDVHNDLSCPSRPVDAGSLTGNKTRAPEPPLNPVDRVCMCMIASGRGMTRANGGEKTIEGLGGLNDKTNDNAKKAQIGITTMVTAGPPQ